MGKTGFVSYMFEYILGILGVLNSKMTIVLTDCLLFECSEYNNQDQNIKGITLVNAYIQICSATESQEKY